MKKLLLSPLAALVVFAALAPSYAHGQACQLSLLFFGNLVCDDNGTPGDPSDDTFTFQLNIVNIGGTGTTWTANDPNTTTGTYGVLTTFGPYPASGGGFNFSVIDDVDPTCIAPLGVIPQCVSNCSISAFTSNIVCDDNGTPNDPSDDTFTIDYFVTGTGTSSTWITDDPNNTSGSYGVVTSAGPFPASITFLTVTVSDLLDPTCTTTFDLIAPGPCSNGCLIDLDVGLPICNDNGTPNNPNDDTFTFTVLATGTNTGTGWQANDPASTSGVYGVPVTFGPYPINGGPVIFNITDLANGSCPATVNVAPPPPCSNACNITDPGIGAITCNDAGTPGIPDDDILEIELNPTGTGLGSNYIVTSPLLSATPGIGTYGVPSIQSFLFAGAQPGATILITITDADDPSCFITFTVPNIAPCVACTITASAEPPECDDNGTPTNPNDDNYTVAVTVSGVGTAAGWTADDPNATLGSYDVPVIFGPYLISAGPITVTITDDNDPTCTFTLTFNPPPPCSIPPCAIDATISNVVCSDNGTPLDPSDDTFTVDYLVTGTGTGAGWTSDDPNGTSGSYGVVTTAGPFPASLPLLTVTVTDLADPGCTASFDLVSPGPCSNGCLIDLVVGPAICDDNGTPSDPSDDTFTFTVLAIGTNTGAAWRATDPALTLGVFGGTTIFGTYPISGGPISFEIFDLLNATCPATVTVTPPTSCSNAPPCNLTDAGIIDVSCNDNGSPNFPPDDILEVTFDPVGTGLSSSYIVSSPLGVVLPGTGNYGTPSVQGLQFAGTLPPGAVIPFTITDANDPTCSITVDVTNTCPVCGITASADVPICDDNGTPNDPADDTYTVLVVLSGGTGANWSADDPNGTTGAYDIPVVFGPYPIAAGPLTVTVTDDGDATCTTSFTLDPPASCSVPPCVLTVAEVVRQCEDNGTPSDPSDDLFTIELTVVGQNTGPGWTASGVNGLYGVPQIFGPFPIAGGAVTFILTDLADPTCSTTLTVAPPPTCSDVPTCNLLDPGIGAITCDDNGTPGFPDDDLLVIELNPTGTALGAGYIVSSPLFTASPGFGTYGTVAVQSFLLAGAQPGVLVPITITDVDDPSCSLTFDITNVSPCVSCAINASLDTPTCNDNGTPNDPSDDTYTILITVDGTATAATWSADDPNATSGNYNNLTLFGPYAIAAGPLSITIRDDNDPNCTTTVDLVPPAPCSTPLCVIDASVANIQCNDNGTPVDPSDDVFFFEVLVVGQNTGSNWTGGGASGLYGVPVVLGPYAIGAGVVNLVLVDETDPSCQTTLSVSPPSTCSNTCSISATFSNVQCDDNGTPVDPSDDLFFFEVLVDGQNVGGGWTGGGASGLYGIPVILGPYPIGAGVVNLVLVDDTDPTCQTTLSVSPPSTCSNTCSISATFSNVQCNDNGTPVDSSDDVFTFEVLVAGQNVGGGWTGGGASGLYGVPVVLGPYSIGAGVVDLVITDDSDPTCQTTLSVSPPSTCSNTCSISATFSNVQCDDNGTPVDPSDDVFTVEVLVVGQNVGSGWTGGGASGSYGTPIVLGPFPISTGPVDLLLADDNDPTCQTTLRIDPPLTCSDACPPPDTGFVAEVICNASTAELIIDTLVVLNDQNCDSILIRSLLFIPLIVDQIDAVICEGDAFFFGDQVLTEAGFYRDTTLAISGCDSIIQLNLEVRSSLVEEQVIDLCEGESYTLNGVEYDETNPSGIQILESSTGCDSIIRVALFYNTLDLAYDTEAATCITGGTFSLNAIDGGQAPFTLQIDGKASTAFDRLPLVLEDLPSGDYEATVVDDRGCDRRFEFNIGPAPTIELDLGLDQTLTLGDSILLQATPPNPNASRLWESEDTTICPDCIEQVVRPLQTTTYQLTLIDEESGCSATDRITLRVDGQVEVYIPNAFSPNEDGANDVFLIYGNPERIERVEVFRVFDRWGAVLFEANEFLPNDPNFGWNGRYRGQDLNPAVFVYYAEVTLINGQRLSLSGDVTLVR
ncbi:MAG: gliding motility-associated C-terminal domain-containing protein [Bacteroidota bacterium]